MKKEATSRSVSFKLRLFVLALSIVGVFLALLATASARRLTGGSPHDLATQPHGLSAVTLARETVQQAWVARYNGPGHDFDSTEAIAVDKSGNVYVTGRSSDPDFSTHFATVKYNPQGQQLWVARYDGPISGSDYAQAIAVDGFGNVYVTGASAQTTNFDSDYATVKYDSMGLQQWVARYNGPANLDDQAHAIALDSSGNVYVTGQSIGLGTDYDYATIKYDLSGNEQWVGRYDGPANYYDVGTAIAVDASANIYVTGSSANVGASTDLDYTTIKYTQSATPSPTPTATPTAPPGSTARPHPTPRPRLNPPARP